MCVVRFIVALKPPNNRVLLGEILTRLIHSQSKLESNDGEPNKTNLNRLGFIALVFMKHKKNIIVENFT